MNVQKFIIPKGSTLKEALEKIEENHHGIVFVVDGEEILGVVTDGDVRRHLLNTGSLGDYIECIANTNFIYGEASETRELLLKKLDNGVRVIPIIEPISNSIIDVVSKDNFPLRNEETVYSRARAPIRVSFGGGGSDVTNYFNGAKGSVINSTISLYSHATLRIREDTKIHVYSNDLKSTLKARNLKELTSSSDNSFGLVVAIIELIKPEFGFDLYLYSDYPLKSGLGGSSAIAVSILGCFNELRQDKWDTYELADIAYQAERHNLGIAGGWQDQYATVFGGMNFIEFKMDQNIVHPLRIPSKAKMELEESLVLCWVGGSHDSNTIHTDQRKKSESMDIQKLVSNNVDISKEMRDELLRGRLSQIGKLMDKAWKIKRQLSNKISSSRLDSIYSTALENGASGGKLLGAGGGGFFLFFVPPFKKNELIHALESISLTIQPFRFDNEGMRSWSVREHR
jgi:D-glycero-alpha-D-manno-heptose-7-phosphate kinase